MFISGILTIASHQLYSIEKTFMIFNGILTFNGQTRECCPIKVNPFHLKQKHILQKALKLNTRLAIAENWHLKGSYAKG
jgi:hypothetical protein